MDTRFYIDPETLLPHIYRHDVSEDEAQQILDHPLEDRAGSDNSRVALGRTAGGRYLRIIYSPDLQSESVFVITGYELTGKPLKAFRRRQKKKHGK